MTGLLVVSPRYLDRQAGLGVIVEELALISEATEPSEWIGVERFIPFLYA